MLVWLSFTVSPLSVTRPLKALDSFFSVLKVKIDMKKKRNGEVGSRFFDGELE